jgi:hypothetical protein
MPLKFEIQKTIPSIIAHWFDRSEIQASSGYNFYHSKDKCTTFEKTGDLQTSFVSKTLAKSRLMARGLRLGIRDMRKLKSGTVLVVADRKIFRSNGSDFKPVLSFMNGVGPLREGWCEDDAGICYLAEYFLNNKRDRSVNLLKSVDDGQSWEIIQSFHHIRHIHCVQYDPFTRMIWIGAGDKDEESSISFSQDQGRTWNSIGSGNQMFRAVSLLFTKDHVYWGSDAPTRQNFIYRCVRKNGSIERLVAVNGPVHYSALLESGAMLFATTAEGNSEGKSAAWDNKAHIWASEDGINWTDVINWEKDIYPYILGLGRVYFAHGQNKDNVCFTTEALKKVDHTLFFAKIVH